MNEQTAQNMGVAGTPADTPDAQDFQYFEVSPSQRYKIGKDEKVPETVAKAMRSLHEHVKTVEAENKAFRDQHETFNKMQQALQNSGENQAPELPDPIQDPKGYREAVASYAETRATNGLEQRQQYHTNMVIEVDLLRNLIDELVPKDTENRAEALKEKYIEALDHATKLGLLESISEKVVNFRPGTARAVFRDLYHDTLIENAKKQGLVQVQDALGNAQNAPMSIPGNMGGKAEANYSEIRRKNPELAAKMRQEASKKIDSQWK